MKQLFQDQYADQSADSKSKLSDELLNRAREMTDIPKAAYVLLNESVSLSVHVGGANVATECLDLLCHRFDVDEVELRVQTIGDIALQIKDSAAITAMINQFRPWFKN